MSLFYYPYPSVSPSTQEPILVEVNARIVPILLSALERYKYKQFWSTEDDYKIGVQELCATQEALLTGTQSITDAIDRVYRLLDTGLNGAVYTSSPNPADPARPIVAPEIPAAPPAVPPTDPAALRAHIARLQQLAENAATGAEAAPGSAMDGTVGLDYAGSWRARLEAVQGEINQGWFGIGGQPARLSDIVTALRIGTPQDAAQIDTALEALSASSSAANIFGVVRGLLGDVVDTGIEGGVLAVLIASSIANAGMLGTLAGQLDALTQRLDRVAAALDGGAVPAPSNVIAELDAIKTMVS